MVVSSIRYIDFVSEWSGLALTILFCQTLSRKVPYYQYPNLDIQMLAMIAGREEAPKRPGVKGEEDSDGESASDPEEGCEEIDDQTWAIIVQCFSPKPEDRPDIARIRELVVDLNIHDERQLPPWNKVRYLIEVKNLHRMEEIFDSIEVRWNLLLCIC